MDASAPPTLSRLGAGRALGVVALLAALFTLLAAVAPGDEDTTRTLVNLTWLAGSGGVVVLLARAAGRCTGTARRAWAFLTASMAVWWAGQAVWTFLEVAQGRVSPFPSVADLAFAVSLPLGMAGVLSFPVGTRNVAARLRRVTDGMIAAAATFCLAWVVLLPDLLHLGATPLERNMGMAYSLVSWAAASVVLMTFSRVRRDQRVVFGLLAAGLLVNAVSTSIFSWLQIGHDYETGGSLDVVWLTGLLLLGAAASRCRDDGDVTSQGPREAPSISGTLLVYLPIGATLVAGVVTGAFFEEIDPPFCGRGSSWCC